jgi:hypothetical protein
MLSKEQSSNLGVPKQPQLLYLTTIGWKTGKQHRIEIWFVEFNRNIM